MSKSFILKEIEVQLKSLRKEYLERREHLLKEAQTKIQEFSDMIESFESFEIDETPIKVNYNEKDIFACLVFVDSWIFFMYKVEGSEKIMIDIKDCKNRVLEQIPLIIEQMTLNIVTDFKC